MHPFIRRRSSHRSDRRSHQLPDHPAVVVDLDRPAVGGLVGRVERDAQAVIERRGDVLGVIGGLGRLLGQGVGPADGDARPDAAAGQQGDAGRRPVVAAGRRVDLGRPAEIAQDDDQGRFEQAPVGEVLEQARDGRVELGQQASSSAT